MLDARLVPENRAKPDLGKIEAGLRQHLTRFNRAQSKELLSELPRNTICEVQQAELRKRFGQKYLLAQSAR